jgi:hypothetical protein
MEARNLTREMAHVGVFIWAKLPFSPLRRFKSRRQPSTNQHQQNHETKVDGWVAHGGRMEGAIE